MTALAFLNTPLKCPRCSKPIADQVWFQWGFCRGRAQDPASTYAVGDAIRWRRGLDGRVHPWTAFSGASGDLGANLGDPAVLDLIVRDWSQTWLRQTCDACGAAIDGAAVRITEGEVSEGFLVEAGTLGPDTYHCLRGAAYDPMPEWNDAPLAVETIE